MEAQVASWDEERAERSVAVLKAVADPSRYRLLWALSERELPVSRLAELIGAHVAATSQHLAKLRAAGLVTSRREGTRIYYRAAGRQVRGLLESAVLAGDAAEALDAAAEAGEVPAAVAQERPAAARARHRPVAET
ncbi:metalloregulator ArsR/SmtB family transcription factor [Streptomyces sp. SID12501]|uniref:Winged helix-turn-helix transcriptional regulator n=1 Tax=Streptomyces sp. SID12501 TaxID=2706042 RepID=A0A6B3BUG9_9ACTN|nr:metalloregulator ArsR/SmtB family transcription factor [Streptomyces sp. SID12501]NEC88031.1 winged helix-turn-helix transcriptional regulator [Streptomyces sp. SID12501]